MGKKKKRNPFGIMESGTEEEEEEEEKKKKKKKKKKKRYSYVVEVSSIDYGLH